MSVRYPVKWYSSQMQSAPELTEGSTTISGHTAGRLTNLLKKILITGFGVLSIDSLSYDAAAGEVTATITEGHSYLLDSILLIEGAEDDAFNGEQRLTHASTTQFRYKPASTPASNTATGTLTAKVAPVGGWEILDESAGGDILAIGSTNPNSGPVKLLVRNDAQASYWYTSSLWAEVSMVEDFVDINTYTEINTEYWHATDVYRGEGWDFIADDRIFYFSHNYKISSSGSSRCDMVAFGDISSVRPNDQYATIQVSSSSSASASTSSSASSSFGEHNNKDKKYLARPHHQLFGATKFVTLGLFPKMGEGIALPNPADNGFYISPTPIPVLEDVDVVRGYLPGMICAYNSNENLRVRHSYDTPAYPNKIIKFVNIPTSDAGTSINLTAFDITGPWVRDNE